MRFKRETEKWLGFPFLKTRSFIFKPFWNNLSQKLGVIYDEFGPLPIRIKKSHLCFEDFKMILLLQNLANLKISPCSLNGVCKILEFWSSSWYFWSFKSFFIFSFWHSFAIIGFHIAILSANTNLKDTGYSFYRSGVSLENYSPW